MKPHPSRWNHSVYVTVLLMAVLVFALGGLDGPRGAHREGHSGVSVAVYPAPSSRILL